MDKTRSSINQINAKAIVPLLLLPSSDCSNPFISFQLNEWNMNNYRHQ